MEIRHETLSGNVSDIIQMVKESGGIDAAKAMMDRYIARGIKVLDALPGNVYREILRQLINKLRIEKGAWNT